MRDCTVPSGIPASSSSWSRQSSNVSVAHFPLEGVLADNVSHAGVPTFFDEASCLNLSYTDRIRGVAGRVFGRANDAPISALSDDESFDIAMSSYVSMIQIQQQSQQDFVQLKADILY